jgi:hypothetical protein
VENHPREEIDAPPIFVFDNAMSRQNRSCVWGMTEPSACGWRVVNRPFPAGLVSGTAKRSASDADDLKSTERKFANLIRPLEGFQHGV